ncbi:MAG: YjcZ family sporulation protein [Bacillaceae bacterium]|nr:YjcZ family sporulation protein [Bacillaceae bacterium]
MSHVARPAGAGFAFILVIFILLVIIGAAYVAY